VAKSIKHSKLKNTGVLFELLVRQITSDTLNGMNVSPALKIVKEYFGKSTVLKKELNLYNSLINEKFANILKAEKFLDVVLKERQKISNLILKRKKYNLIKEINNNYDLESFFKTKISNYKLNASIYKLFETQKNDKINNPKIIMECKDTVIDHISTSSPKTIQERVLKEYSKQDKGIRLLSYKLLLEKFNEKYGTSLDSQQRNLLRKYINEDSGVVVNYINKEANTERKKIVKAANNIGDKVTSIKLKEVANQLKKIEKSKRLNEKHLTTLMNTYELVKECKRVNK
tara:strand:- start:7512 stop:8372 length:861 start_codon:yes stop_codon:yes gene_type:complete